MKYCFFILFVIRLFPSIGQESFIPSSMTKESKELKQISKDKYYSEIALYKEKYKGKKYSILKENLFVRRKSFDRMVESGILIIDGDLFDYVEGVLNKVIASVGIEGERKLYLIRNSYVNAFNIGDDNIYVHTGLVFGLENEDQLAFVLGHELGHNELRHYEAKLIDHADMEMNDSIKKQMRNIKYMPYGRVSAYNELLTPWILASKEKSRFAEDEADEFGSKCLMAGDYDFNKAKNIFDIFETDLSELDTVLFDLTTLLNLFENGNDFDEALEVNTTSSLGTFTKKKVPLEDELRTHPFGKERKEAFIERIEGTDKTGSKTNTDFEQYRKLAANEIILNAMFIKQIDQALYYSLRRFEKEPKDAFINKIIPLSFAYLGYEKQRRRAGRHIKTINQYFSEPYNQLIYFLREISPKQCFTIAKYWIANYADISDNDILNPALAVLDIQEKDKEKFDLRYLIEEEKENNYYILSILDQLKNEYIK